MVYAPRPVCRMSYVGLTGMRGVARRGPRVPYRLSAALTPGQRRRRRRLDKMSGWPDAARTVGLEGLHFHDLRHTGNQFAAHSGAPLKDLMARMGHDNERAALIYQHEARGADKRITDAIELHVQAERINDDDDGPLGRPRPSGDGPLMARQAGRVLR